MHPLQYKADFYKGFFFYSYFKKFVYKLSGCIKLIKSKHIQVITVPLESERETQIYFMHKERERERGGGGDRTRHTERDKRQRDTIRDRQADRKTYCVNIF